MSLGLGQDPGAAFPWLSDRDSALQRGGAATGSSPASSPRWARRAEAPSRGPRVISVTHHSPPPPPLPVPLRRGLEVLGTGHVPHAPGGKRGFPQGASSPPGSRVAGGGGGGGSAAGPRRGLPSRAELASC